LKSAPIAITQYGRDTPVQCNNARQSTAFSLQAPTRCGVPVAQGTTPFAARYDIGALQRSTFKISTLGVFINSEWRACGNSGSDAFGTRNWARRSAGIPTWGHSDLGAQSGRKTQPACYSYCDFVKTLHSRYWFVQVQVQVLVLYALYF